MWPVLVVALALCVAVQVLTIAAAGRLVGVTIRKISLGIGPTLLRIGRCRIAPIPAGGYVRFKDSREEQVPSEAMESAFDGRPMPEKVFISLSGCVALCLVAGAALGMEGMLAFWQGPGQWIRGALSPGSAAQALLHDGAAALRHASLIETCGLVAAKMAALNILPLPYLNGGAAVQALFEDTAVARLWPPAATAAAGIGTLAITFSWGAAVVMFLL